MNMTWGLSCPLLELRASILDSRHVFKLSVRFHLYHLMVSVRIARHLCWAKQRDEWSSPGRGVIAPLQVPQALLPEVLAPQ